jgi:hypothetical protein
MTVAYTSPGQPWANRDSSSQKAHANGWTISLHVLVFRKADMGVDYEEIDQESLEVVSCPKSNGEHNASVSFNDVTTGPPD